MGPAFQLFKTLFGGCLGLLLMGLFFRILGSGELPDPDEPGLSAPQRAGIWNVQEALRASPFLIRLGLTGTVICALGMAVTTVLR